MSKDKRVGHQKGRKKTTNGLHERERERGLIWREKG